MFTGLVQGLGRIAPMGTEKLQISCVSGAAIILPDLNIGDSVAVDGACLTATDFLPNGFVAIASPETLRRTTLAHQTDAYVNLETSLRVGSKLGGHFVTGHVDGIGAVQQTVQTASSWDMTFSAPPSLLSLWQRQIAPYLVPKGSVAVNGISLTVAECDPAGSWFKAAVIPHTYHETNLRFLQVGDWVNLEADILGKYVAKFVRSGLPSPSPSESLNESAPSIHSLDRITPAFLAENGYL
jgi:riboflavin synthase